MVESAHVLFELRRPENENDKLTQAQLELLAADRISNYRIIVILTDLQDSWKLLWLEKAPPSEETKGQLAHVCCTEVTAELAIGFLRHHLKVISKMLARGGFVVAPEDGDGDDGRDDDDSGNDKDQNKRRKIAGSSSKDRPTFAATTVANMRHLVAGRAELENSEEYQRAKEIEEDMTDKEFSERIIWNFYDRHRHRLELKS